MAAGVEAIDGIDEAYWIENEAYSPQLFELFRNHFNSQGEELQFEAVERNGKWGYIVSGDHGSGHDQAENHGPVHTAASPLRDSIPKRRRLGRLDSNRSSRVIPYAPLSWLSATSDHVRPTSKSSFSSDRIRLRLAGDKVSFIRSSNGSFNWRSSLSFLGLRSSKASDEVHHFIPEPLQDTSYGLDHLQSQEDVEESYVPEPNLAVRKLRPSRAGPIHVSSEAEGVELDDSTLIANAEYGRRTGDEHDEALIPPTMPDDFQMMASETASLREATEQISGAEADKAETRHWNSDTEDDAPSAQSEEDNSVHQQADISSLEVHSIDLLKVSSDESCFLILAAILRRYSILSDWACWSLWIEYDDQTGRHLEPTEQPVLVFNDLDQRGLQPLLMLCSKMKGMRPYVMRLQLSQEGALCCFELEHTGRYLSWQPETTTVTPDTKVDFSNHSSVEIFKSFKVGLDDPCYRVLPAALRKYNIQTDWRQYALYIVYGDQERCVLLEEMPLAVFKELDQKGLKPMFMLRKLAQPTTANDPSRLKTLSTPLSSISEGAMEGTPF